MPWARVDDNWWCHPKVMPLSLNARGLWITALSWSCAQRTDTIPEIWFRTLPADDLEAASNELIDAKLWKKTRDGVQIHDWNEYQSDAAKRKEAGKKGGEASGRTRRTQGKRDENDDEAKILLQRSTKRSKKFASTEAGPSHPNPSQPDPSHPIPSSSHISDITQEDDEVIHSDDDEKTIEERTADIAKLIARRRTEKAKPRSPNAYLAAVAAAILEEETGDIAGLIERYPTAPDSVIAAAIEGETQSLRYHSS